MLNFKDNKVRNRIVSRLRSTPEDEVANYIYELLDYRQPHYDVVVLEIIRRISLPKEIQYRVLEFSLENCNVSSVSIWLQTLYAVLGYKRVFNFLKEKALSRVEQVEMTLYQLSWIVDKSSQQEVKLYKELLVLVAFNLPEESKAMVSFRHFMGWLQAQYPILVEVTAYKLSKRNAASGALS